jgi:hypothetical protein
VHKESPLTTLRAVLVEKRKICGAGPATTCSGYLCQLRHGAGIPLTMRHGARRKTGRMRVVLPSALSHCTAEMSPLAVASN